MKQCCIFGFLHVREQYTSAGKGLTFRHDTYSRNFRVNLRRLEDGCTGVKSALSPLRYWRCCVGTCATVMLLLLGDLAKLQRLRAALRQEKYFCPHPHRLRATAALLRGCALRFL